MRQMRYNILTYFCLLCDMASNVVCLRGCIQVFNYSVKLKRITITVLVLILHYYTSITISITIWLQVV